MSETQICDFPRDPDCAARSAPLSKPVAQLDDVHSVLRLNYETPKGLISLAPPSVAKPTLCETRRRRLVSDNLPWPGLHPPVKTTPNEKRILLPNIRRQICSLDRKSTRLNSSHLG